MIRQQFEQGFVDAVAEDDLLLLFQLASDATTEMCWDDGGYIYFWIRPTDLKQHRFSTVLVDKPSAVNELSGSMASSWVCLSRWTYRDLVPGNGERLDRPRSVRYQIRSTFTWVASH